MILSREPLGAGNLEFCVTLAWFPRNITYSWQAVLSSQRPLANTVANIPMPITTAYATLVNWPNTQDPQNVLFGIIIGILKVFYPGFGSPHSSPFMFTIYIGVLWICIFF